MGAIAAHPRDLAERVGRSPRALVSAHAGLTFGQARADRAHWGRLTESVVGAHLANAMAQGECELAYWRDSKGNEVDFVVKSGPDLLAIEVKSGSVPERLPGLAGFAAGHKGARGLVVGGNGVPLVEFLQTPVREWLRGANARPNGT